MANHREIDPARRRFLQTGGAALMLGTAVTRAARAAAAPGSQSNAVKLPRLLASTENEPEPPAEPLPPGKRIGFAIVGLGHLALEQILPAFGESRRCRPV